LIVNGQPRARGALFRYGFVPHLEGDDLVIWLQLATTSPTQISIANSPAR
jgi:hypothetical protein